MSSSDWQMALFLVAFIIFAIMEFKYRARDRLGTRVGVFTRLRPVILIMAAFAALILSAFSVQYPPLFFAISAIVIGLVIAAGYDMLSWRARMRKRPEGPRKAR